MTKSKSVNLIEMRLAPILVTILVFSSQSWGANKLPNSEGPKPRLSFCERALTSFKKKADSAAIFATNMLDRIGANLSPSSRQNLKSIFNCSEIAFKIGFSARIEAMSNAKLLITSSSQTREDLLPMILRNIPDWKSDLDIWAFEAPINLVLFAKDSKLPTRFAAGTVVVMRDWFPIKGFPVIDASSIRISAPSDEGS